MTAPGRLVNEFISARKNDELVVLEGFHALKHALRFGADIRRCITSDRTELSRLAEQLAPDVAGTMIECATSVDSDVFERLAPRPPRTGVIAVARRPEIDGAALLSAERNAPLVLLERPTHLGNVGAVVRLAAGAGAAGVITSGVHDPWGPDAVRGGAGLQFALPVARIDDLFLALDERRGPLFALDPTGEALTAHGLPPNAIIAFGTERAGLSDDLLRRADGRVAIPMQPGVSSLNLATSAAVVLYAGILPPRTEGAV